MAEGILGFKRALLPINDEDIIDPLASEGGKRVVASPYAKQLAKEYKIDLTHIVGTGPMGRIVAKDVEAARGKSESTPAVAVAAAPVSGLPPKQPVTTPAAATTIVPGTTVPFTTMQSAVSKNMVESQTVPAFRVGYTITTDKLDALYKQVCYFCLYFETYYKCG